MNEKRNLSEPEKVENNVRVIDKLVSEGRLDDTHKNNHHHVATLLCLHYANGLMDHELVSAPLQMITEYGKSLAIEVQDAGFRLTLEHVDWFVKDWLRSSPFSDVQKDTIAASMYRMSELGGIEPFIEEYNQHNDAQKN